jgi:hypothetical protein
MLQLVFVKKSLVTLVFQIFNIIGTKVSMGSCKKSNQLMLQCHWKHFMTMTHYVDANIMHDVITERSVTAILHLANKTPSFDTKYKNQNHSENSYIWF